MTTTNHPPAHAPSASAEPAAVRLARVSWQVSVHRDTAGVPRLPPEYVAEQGQLVRILDVREEAELTGPLGHIPAVTHVSFADLGKVPAILDHDTCVVVVSNRGSRAGVAARFLEELGMKRVAAMDGGMAHWKQLGFTTLRDDASWRRELKAIAPGLGRDGKPLVAEGKGRLTATEIAEHIGDATSVRWVKLAAFLLHGKRSCVDGRDDHGVIGTPGGDTGELLLAMGAAEKLSGKALEYKDVVRLLEKHIDTFGRFYMHTDTHAMNRVIVDGFRKDERIIPHIGKTFEGHEWRAWSLNPPKAARPAILDHLSKPENMGCGHLRFAMTDSETYGVRPEVAKWLLRAFHELRWAGAPEIEWVILGGDHVEGAVASVVVDGGLHSYTRIPLVSPMVAGKQMFVNHPQVTSFLRKEMASFLAQADLVAASDEQKLAEGIETLGAKQAGATLGKLAKGLPIFELRFDADGKPGVTEVGQV